jgi:hypothetical protein
VACSIHAGSLDVAVPGVAGQKAIGVEQCTCPPGYSGLSCQVCKHMFCIVVDTFMTCS